MKNTTRIIHEVDRSLDAIIGSKIPALKKIKAFVIASGGKRFRSFLHYYTAKILGYDNRSQTTKWQDIGAVTEIIHAASLLHDDVVDEAKFRRNRPSINSLYGNKTSVLAGDYLLASSLEHLSSLENAQELVPLFTRVLRMLSEGELIQMQYEGHTNINKKTEKIYENIILKKTGCLFGFSTETAYILNFASKKGNRRYEDNKKEYRHFGERIGRLFQMRDDFFDYFQDTVGSTGKEAYQDFTRGLVTRPIIVLHKHLSIRNRHKLLTLLSYSKKERQKPHNLQTMRMLFDSVNLRYKLEQEIEEEVHALMSFLRKHPPSFYRDKLMESFVELFILC